MLASRSTEQSRTRPVPTLREVLDLLAFHWELTWAMAKRELTERYTGQILGSIWVVVHPLLIMAVYVFMFAFVFKIKVGGQHAIAGDYIVYLLAGLIPWMAIQDSMNKGCRYITTNAPLVKQVVFPLEVLPVKGVLPSFINQIIATVLLIGYVLVKHGSVGWTYLLLPLLFVFQLLAMIGVNFLLSSVSVYFRDMTDLVQVFSFVGLYLLPVFYLPEWVPDLLRPLLYVNPYSYVVWCYQDALVYGGFVHWWAWIMFPVLSGAVLYVGYRTFRKLRTTFANVL